MTTLSEAAKERLDKFPHYHGCFTGDCPHEKQTECFKAIFEYGYTFAKEETHKEIEASAGDITLIPLEDVRPIIEAFIPCEHYLSKCAGTTLGNLYEAIKAFDLKYGKEIK